MTAVGYSCDSRRALAVLQDKKLSPARWWSLISIVVGYWLFANSLETYYFLFSARSMATAMATVAPTMGLLPMPRKPIIST